MSDEIRLMLHTDPAQANLAQGQAVARVQGRAGQMLTIGGTLLGALLFSLLTGYLTGLRLMDAIMIGLWAWIGMWVTYLLVYRLNTRKWPIIQREDWRWKYPTPVTLRPDGLVLEARLVPWDAGHGTSRLKDATVLHLGRLDTVVIPDADLPPGLSPENLQTKIAGWRSQCPPF